MKDVSFEVEVKLHEGSEAPTFMLAAPPADEKEALDGVSPKTHPLSWLIVNGWFAMVSVVLRVAPEFACTL